MIERIRLSGFLSFQPDSPAIAVSPSNLLLGPNGSGKSNLVEGLALLKAAPRDIVEPIRQGGGIRDLLWSDGVNTADAFTLEVTFAAGRLATHQPYPMAVRYRITLGMEGEHATVVDERLENVAGVPKPYFYFGYENGRPMINALNGQGRSLARDQVDRTRSILAQRRDPDAFPELTSAGDLLGSIRIYRRWTNGPDAVVREACRADEPTDHLRESLDNLPARIAELRKTPSVKRRLNELVAMVAPGFSEVDVAIEGGRLQLRVTDGERSVPARRLSDGTLRMLCLAAVLVDPAPGSLLVIEEPELALHPDLLPTVADLLAAASAKATVIATTHSPVLADAFSERASDVLVFERAACATQVVRLDPAAVGDPRAQGGLGGMWLAGKLGGTRW